MAHFLSLPDEIILKILCDDSLSIVDVCNLCCICQRLKNMEGSNNLWRIKFRQAWRWIWNNLPPDHGINDWRNEILVVATTMRKARNMIESCSPKLYSYSNLTAPVVDELEALMTSSPCADIYCLYQLNLWCGDTSYPVDPAEGESTLDDAQLDVSNAEALQSLPKYENLTIHHYARKLQKYVHQFCCKKDWKKFLSLPPEEQSLERGAVLFSKWFQPTRDILVTDIEKQMSEIAVYCRKSLLRDNPNHPLSKTEIQPPKETLLDTHWSEADSQAVFKVVNNVVYKAHGFRGAKEDYYDFKNSFLDQVLEDKSGIPITLSILYHSLCHRLGILLRPVNFPTHFMLSWIVPGKGTPLYIDAYNEGMQLTEAQLRKRVPFNMSLSLDLEPCSALSVFQRMSGNSINMSRMMISTRSDHLEVFCRALQLMLLLRPSDQDIERLLYRVYFSMDIHYDRIVSGVASLKGGEDNVHLRQICQDAKVLLEGQIKGPPTIYPKLRKMSSNLEFGVGMVMKHKKYSYTCVIIGWDELCTMPETWVRQMSVYSLKNQKNQPFYNVLAHDGTRRYAAQENLEPSTNPQMVTHPEIGRYFKAFDGRFYIPNDELEKEYSQDSLLRQELK